VRKQNCSSFASFGFERWLVWLANVLQCGWGFFLLFAGGKKKQNKFPSNLHCPVKKLNPFYFQFITIVSVCCVCLYTLATNISIYVTQHSYSVYIRYIYKRLGVSLAKLVLFNNISKGLRIFSIYRYYVD
jgi:TRAP-type C4-dicarboxylate transport system permease small subunit